MWRSTNWGSRGRCRREFVSTAHPNSRKRLSITILKAATSVEASGTDMSAAAIGFSTNSCQGSPASSWAVAKMGSSSDWSKREGKLRRTQELDRNRNAHRSNGSTETSAYVCMHLMHRFLAQRRD
jgi:hypothetical protein